MDQMKARRKPMATIRLTAMRMKMTLTEVWGYH
jgi:hypothetical protein